MKSELEVIHEESVEAREQSSLHKTVLCSHQRSCLQSILRVTCKNFLIGFAVKSGINILFSFKKILKNPMFLKKQVLSLDSLAFASFLGLFVLLFKSIICLLRRLFKEQKKWAGFLGGFIAGFLSIRLLKLSTKRTLTLFLLARALDSIYQYAISKNYIPKFKYDYVLLYSLLMMVTGYCYANEPNCLSPDMNRFYLKFTNQNINDLQIREIWIRQKNVQLQKKGVKGIDPLDYIPRLKKFYEKMK